VLARLHVLLLHTYRRLPVWARRRVVRSLAPSFTVGAMCFVTRDDGHLLLVRHLYRTDWGVTGGLLKRGEVAADGARRETFEEVGLAVDLHGQPVAQVDPEARRVDVIYRAVPAVGADPTTARPCSPEIVEVRWFPLSELPPLQHETAGALEILGRNEVERAASLASLADVRGTADDGW
jgi:ADP-ribose pyrophosphatase YjhB (NUDIX family)